VLFVFAQSTHNLFAVAVYGKIGDDCFLMGICKNEGFLVVDLISNTIAAFSG